MATVDDFALPQLTFEEQASDPATPASGFGRLFIKADGIYFIDDAGTVTGPLGGGGGSAGRTLITDTTLGSDGTFTFSSIPSGYKHLSIEGRLRSDNATTLDRYDVRVGNGTVDTGSNYLYTSQRFGTTSGTKESASDTSFSPTNSCAANTATAGVFSFLEFTIQNYADTATGRVVDGRHGYKSSSDGYQGIIAGQWANTADVIDIITVAPALGTNFKAGSRLALYGLA